MNLFDSAAINMLIIITIDVTNEPWSLAIKTVDYDKKIRPEKSLKLECITTYKKVPLILLQFSAVNNLRYLWLRKLRRRSFVEMR